MNNSVIGMSSNQLSRQGSVMSELEKINSNSSVIISLLDALDVKLSPVLDHDDAVKSGCSQKNARPGAPLAAMLCDHADVQEIVITRLRYLIERTEL